MRDEFEYVKGNNIFISVEDEVLAAVEECKIYSKRNGRAVSGYGEDNVFGISLGNTVHYVTLKRITMKDAVSFRNLSEFDLVILKPYEKLTFSGCEWTELSESITPSDDVIETASLCAKSLDVSEVSL